MPADFYSVLEVAPRASQEVVEAAWKTLAKSLRSDLKAFQAINEAHETLGDPVKRNAYDNQRKNDKVIGNYRIVKQLAEGGFGQTYLAEHVISGSQVCIKHAHQVSAQDEAILLEEAKAIWDLRHYGIPTIRDIIRLPDGSLALVMSYIPGPTLAEYVEKHKKLEPWVVACIVDRAINALKYIHFHGIVHGDVKPQNIIIQPEIHGMVLVDYGLSAIRPKRGSLSKGYTPHFAPPEQISGSVLLPESDFYSLGVTMIYALGGSIDSRKVPSDTPDAMRHFIKKLLTHDILGRPNWQKENLSESFTKVRKESFGHATSNMKPFPKM